MSNVAAKRPTRRASTSTPVRQARRRSAATTPTDPSTPTPSPLERDELRGPVTHAQREGAILADLAGVDLSPPKHAEGPREPKGTLLGIAIDALSVGHTDVILGIIEEACSSLEVLETLAAREIDEEHVGLCFGHVAHGIRRRLMLVHRIRHAQLVAAEVES